VVNHNAGVAQSVEQLIRNEKVACSIHVSGTNSIKDLASQKAKSLILSMPYTVVHRLHHRVFLAGCGLIGQGCAVIC
jgi:hypothetical protein